MNVGEMVKNLRFFVVANSNGAIVRVGPSFEPQALRRLLSVMADADG
jgi:hypothetical protein